MHIDHVNVVHDNGMVIHEAWQPYPDADVAQQINIQRMATTDLLTTEYNKDREGQMTTSSGRVVRPTEGHPLRVHDDNEARRRLTAIDARLGSIVARPLPTANHNEEGTRFENGSYFPPQTTVDGYDDLGLDGPDPDWTAVADVNDQPDDSNESDEDHVGKAKTGRNKKEPNYHVDHDNYGGDWEYKPETDPVEEVTRTRKVTKKEKENGKTDTVEWVLQPDGILQDARTQPRTTASVINYPRDMAKITPIGLFRHMMPAFMVTMREMCKFFNENKAAKFPVIDLGMLGTLMGLYILMPYYGNVKTMFATSIQPNSLALPNNFGALYGVGRDLFKHWRSLAVLNYYKATDGDGNPNPDPWCFQSKYWARLRADRPTKIHAGWLITIDEMMCAWKGRVSKAAYYVKGFLPHLSFVPRKPEPLGAEAKTLHCSKTRIMFGAEFEKGKAVMPKLDHGPSGRTTGGLKQHPHTVAVQLRAVAPFVGSGRVLVGDAWFGTWDAAMALMKAGMHTVLKMKGKSALFPYKELETFTPKGIGNSVVYQAKVKGKLIPVYAMGVMAGQGRVNMFLTTNGTSHLVDRKEFTVIDDVTHKVVHLSYPRNSVDQTFSAGQPGCDVHNKLRQWSLGIERCCPVRGFEQRAFQTGLGCLVVDTFLAARLTRLKGLYKRTDLAKFVKALGLALLKNPWRSLAHKAKCVPLHELAIRVQRRSANQLAELQNISNEVPHSKHVSMNKGRAPGAPYKSAWCVICNTKSSWICKTCRQPVCKIRNECIHEHAADPTLNNRSTTPRSTGARRTRSESPPDGQQGRNVRQCLVALPR